MSNYCSNFVEIKGSKSALVALRLCGVDVSFETLAPTPPELFVQGAPIKDKVKKLENIKKFGAPDWYEWRFMNWGTKRDCGKDIKWECKRGKFVARFDSAWSPPVAAFAKFSEFHPGIIITLRYCEPGLDFAGVAVIKDGVVDDDYHEPMTKADRRYWGYEEVS